MSELTIFILIGLCSSFLQLRGETADEGIELFEKRIRPVLAQDCYECHRSGVTEKGGLALDHREALRKGGRSGEVIVPGNPEASLLIQAIRHHREDLKMPKSRARLEPAVVADFEKWVSIGAPDPRDQPASDEEINLESGWDAVMRRRTLWWSFQPVRKQTIPATSPDGTSAHPIDLFVRAKLKELGLVQAKKATPRTLLRRLSYALRGLPPKPEEIAHLDKQSGESAYEKLVEVVLASPYFGEHWARHWMDWVRYADSHGSEGDPMIPYAWRYRDYLIRALNQDVPFDQLLREHLAGDLLANPRINRELGLNESALGIGHYRMLLHGFAPTDPLEERVRYIDDQIDVISKAFLGITISCARCHNHKFDPISQKDFYALYGILAATTPASIGVEVRGPESLKKREELASQKGAIKAAVVEAWMCAAEGMAAKLVVPDEVLRSAITKGKESNSILNPFWLVQKHSGNVRKAMTDWRNQHGQVETNSIPFAKRWKFQSVVGNTDWITNGSAAFSSAGDFIIARDGERILEAILPAGVYSHLTSTKDRAVFISPNIALDRDYDLWLRVAGAGGAVARYVIQNYPRDGSIYPVTRLNGGDWRWVKHSLDYWTGDRMHVELSTAADQAVLADSNATRSWFGISEVLVAPHGGAKPSEGEAVKELVLHALRDLEPDSVHGLGQGYARALREALVAWKEDRMTDAQADFLNQTIQLGLIDNSFRLLPSVKSLVTAYRALENSIPEPVRAPGVIETHVEDQPLLVRGNHKHPGEIVPRRFLEAFDSPPYETTQSGRVELAEDFLQRGNALTSRVIVNRVWHYLFGRGLVATPDNLGRLGELPSHPELLDFLAGWFADNGYSIKKLIRFIVVTETWQAASKAPPGALEKDPENKFLSHANLRRLEAESIRDALLAVSGDLAPEMYGPPVLGATPRRSVYVRAKRNDLDLLLSIFDAPVPSGAKGRRDVTNVPGQSLALLNDEFVTQLAENWAEHLASNSEITNRTSTIETMFLRAFGRHPAVDEIEASERLLTQMGRQAEIIATQRVTLQRDFLQKTRELEALKQNAKTHVERLRVEGITNTARSFPRPAAAWDFREGLQDQIGNLHGTPMGNAHVADGALRVDGNGSYVSTAPLEFPLREKTLAVWVQLDALDQQGGGVMTVQDLAGNVFDSIVFGEQRAAHWIAGSDLFNRTSDLSAPPETKAHKTPVHLAIVYALDGTITVFRNGQPHGKSYSSKGPVQFASGSAQVLFGNRHGAPGGNRNLRGQIFRAQLFATALNAHEIAALARDSADFITEEDLLAVLTAAERQDYESLKLARKEIEQTLRKMDLEKGFSSPWANLAHALFNLKEFIYIQ